MCAEVFIYILTTFQHCSSNVFAMIVAWKTEKVVSIQSRKHIKHSIKVSSATQTPQILSKLKPLYISVQKSY